MKNYKIILLTGVILSLILLIACSDNSAVKEPTGSAESAIDTPETETVTENIYIPELPEEEFGGYTFKVASGSENTTFDIWTFDVKEQSGEVVEDSFYLRNRAVEEKYGIAISAGYVNNSTVTKAIRAGEDAYDIVFERAVTTVSMILNNLICDLNTVPYLNLDYPYWDQNSVKDLSVNNKVHMIAGDIQLSSFDCTWTLYFDKDMLTDYNLESPYTYIDSDTWTFDAFFDMAKAVKSDLNGDGVMDRTDQWGFSTHQGTYPGLIIAAGENFSHKDSKDIPQLAMSSPAFQSVYEKVLYVMHQDEVTFDPIEREKGYGDNPQVGIFVQNRALFFSEVMNIILTNLREKENDYGMIPWPKYSESQERYRNYVHESAAVLSIPVTAGNIDRTGILVEALAYESTETVRNAYYEIAIKDKYSRDDRMEEMLDLIFDNRSYDLAFIYSWGGFRDAFYKLAVANSSDLTSFISTYETKIAADIDKLLTAIN